MNKYATTLIRSKGLALHWRGIGATKRWLFCILTLMTGILLRNAAVGGLIHECRTNHCSSYDQKITQPGVTINQDLVIFCNIHVALQNGL